MKIGLGTVQFGLDYGISNRDGRTSTEAVREILLLAQARGISVLDTAALYGSSEETLGMAMPAGNSFRIVTKTPKVTGAQVEAADCRALDAAFRRSLARLGVPSVYGLLVHDSNDLLKPGGEGIHAWMERLKAEGAVTRIGASVYTGEQIDALRARYPLDLYQVPLNILDQRLIRSGRLRALKASGVEIHARSIFLQGLLLMDPDGLPAHFEGVRDRLLGLRDFLGKHRLTPLQASVGFAAGQDDVDVLVCGVNRAEQLEEICAACRPAALDFSAFACEDATVLDPSLWRL